MNSCKFINFRKVCCTRNLYRTGESLNESIDSDTIKASNIDMFIDLRNISDCQVCTNYNLLKKSGIKYFSFPLNDRETNFFQIKEPNEKDYAEYYLKIFFSNIEMIRKIFNCILEENFTSLLIGCKFGKDRTGIIIYLILSLLDIEESVIFFDYAKSAEYLNNKKLIEKYYTKSYLSFNPNQLIINMFNVKIKDAFSTRYELIEYLGLNSEKIQIMRGKFYENFNNYNSAYS